MQQVGAQAFAAAEAVDPRHLPVPIALRRRALVRVSHVWVLHRPLLIRIAAAILALLAIVGAYEARDQLAAGGNAIVKFVQGEFTAAGFAITEIKISGQTLTSDRDIVALLTLSAGTSTLNFDAQKAMTRLHWLRAVDTATVRKIYPGQIIVEITEKTPVVRWRSGSTMYLVDWAGKPIGVDNGRYADLPLVVGDGAADDALVMVRMLKKHADLQDGLAALSRIGDRRWDLIYYSGLRVQLPEQGVAQALDQLDKYQGEYALLQRDVTQIDLRVPGFVALKPGELAAKQIADEAAAARKGRKAGGDAEYETAAERQAEQKQQ